MVGCILSSSSCQFASHGWLDDWHLDVWVWSWGVTRSKHGIHDYLHFPQIIYFLLLGIINITISQYCFKFSMFLSTDDIYIGMLLLYPGKSISRNTYANYTFFVSTGNTYRRWHLLKTRYPVPDSPSPTAYFQLLLYKIICTKFQTLIVEIPAARQCAQMC